MFTITVSATMSVAGSVQPRTSCLLLVGVHQGHQLGLLLSQLLLARHQVALALSQLALHISQALQRASQLVALLVHGGAAQAHAAACVHAAAGRARVHAAKHLLLRLHGHAKAVHNILGGLRHLLGGRHHAAALGQEAHDALGLRGLGGLVVAWRVLQALHEHVAQVLLVQVLVEDGEQLGHIALHRLLVLVLVVARPLLEQRAQLGVRDVVGGARAQQRAPLVAQQLVQLGVDAHGLVRLLLDLGEGIHDNGEQEVEQHHEHQQLVGPEEQRAGHRLQAAQRAQVLVDVNVAQQDLKARVDRVAKRLELLNRIAEDEMRHHGVSHKHHACHNGKVDQVGAGQPQGAGDHTQAGLEVHQAQHAGNEQQDVDAVERKVPVEHVDQVLQVVHLLPGANHLGALLVQRQEVGGRREVGVHVVAQRGVELLGVVLLEDPPDDHAGGQQAVGDEVHPVPAVRKELEEVLLLALGLEDLVEGPQHHAEDPDGQDDLKRKAHVVLVAVVQLHAHGVQAVRDLDGAAVGEEELDVEVAKDAQGRVVRHHLGRQLPRVLVQEEALLQVRLPGGGAILRQVDVKEDGEAGRLVTQREVVERVGQALAVVQLRAVGRGVGRHVLERHVVRGVGEQRAVVELHDQVAVDVIVVRVIQRGAQLEHRVHAERLEGDGAGARLLNLGELGLRAVRVVGAELVQQHAADHAVSQANVALAGSGVVHKVAVVQREHVVRGGQHGAGDVGELCGLQGQGAVAAGALPQGQSLGQGDDALVGGGLDGRQLVLHGLLQGLLGSQLALGQTLDGVQGGGGGLGSSQGGVLLANDLVQLGLHTGLASSNVLATSLDQIDQAVVVGAGLGQLVGTVHLGLQLGHLGGNVVLLGLDLADLGQHRSQLGRGVLLQLTAAANAGLAEVGDAVGSRGGH
mmetsp:Transcript_10686/g.26369  ORF Transcript_10686/g.26369 Transcript_10686/m.26369 type:complete len:912 (-) Transcript_10686:2466-5201(-)